MTSPHREAAVAALTFWLKRGRELLGNPRASGSELRAAAIGVQRSDQNMSRELATRAASTISRFTQKNKL